MAERRKFTVRVQVIKTYEIGVDADGAAAAIIEVESLDEADLDVLGVLVDTEVTNAEVVAEDEGPDDDDAFTAFPLD